MLANVMEARHAMSSAGMPAKLSAQRREGILEAASPRRPSMVENEEGVRCGVRTALTAPTRIALQCARCAGVQGHEPRLPKLGSLDM